MRKLKLVALILAFSATFVLTACGQKGPLYISADTPAQTSDATPEAEAEKLKKQGEMSQ